MPRGISSRSSTAPLCGSMRRMLALVAFPGAVPQLAVDPGHAGDEAVRLDGAHDRAGRRDRSGGSCDRGTAPPTGCPRPRRGPSRSRCRAPGSTPPPRRWRGRSCRCAPRRSGRGTCRRRRCRRRRRGRACASASPLSGSKATSRAPVAAQTRLAVVGDAVDAGRRRRTGRIRARSRPRAPCAWGLVCLPVLRGHRLAPCGAPRIGAVRANSTRIGSAAGSNKIVVNPASGGDSQRRARARPIAAHPARRPPARPARAARCAGWRRAPAPGPRSTRPRRRTSSASSDAWSPSIGGASTTTARSPRGCEHEAARGGLDARQRRDERAQAADLDAQPRAVRLVGVGGCGTRARSALRDRRRRARPRRARAPARTAPAGAPAAARRRRRAGRGGRHRPPARPRPAAPRLRRGAAPARRRRRRAARRDDRAPRAPPPPRPAAPARARARPPRARGPAPPAPAPMRSERSASSAAASSATAASDGGRPRASSCASAAAASSRRPSSSSRRAAISRACSALA